ncbi:unnamed protein product [Linum trigynum]|uniref:Uncharacterized protein n=1 Tax=Linum trigynum TaxID=586398 RepID=A0AAV2DFN3_9ROSI
MVVGSCRAQKTLSRASYIATLLRIKLNPNHLRVACSTGADVLVGRIVEETLSIPDLRLCNAGNPLKHQFNSPEAPSSELAELLAGGGESSGPWRTGWGTGRRTRAC